MKTFLSAIFTIIIASSSAFGWVIEKPVDYSKQLQQADFVGVVEVTKIVETGRKKAILLPDQPVQFRELSLELKVLSALKGSGSTIKCSIYREPTEDELRADGIPEHDVFRLLVTIGTDEMLQLFLARITKGAHLLAYLKSGGSDYSPVTGDLNSSHSLLMIHSSNLIDSHSEEEDAEQDGTVQPATRPESKPKGGDKPQPEAEGHSR
jgi:hypothetical protein